MPKLPHPRRPLTALRGSDVRALRPNTRLYRIYRAGGKNPAAWNSMRSFGPTAARFDPHEPPPRDQARGVLYAAGSIPTTIAEAFGSTRLVSLSRDDPWLVAFRLKTSLRLLDLEGAWPTRAGASQAISSGDKNIAREWARMIYEEYDVDGLLYPSSMSGSVRQPGDPRLHGKAVALFDRASRALPIRPALHLPLAHPGLAEGFAVAADRFNYRLLP